MCAVLSFLYGGRKPSSSKRSFVISLVKCVSEKQRTSKSQKLSLIKSNLCLMLRVLRCKIDKQSVRFCCAMKGPGFVSMSLDNIISMYINRPGITLHIL